LDWNSLFAYYANGRAIMPFDSHVNDFSALNLSLAVLGPAPRHHEASGAPATVITATSPTCLIGKLCLLLPAHRRLTNPFTSYVLAIDRAVAFILFPALGTVSKGTGLPSLNHPPHFMCEETQTAPPIRVKTW